MLTIFRRKRSGLTQVFSGHFIDAKTFYAWYFHKAPSIIYLGDLDANKAQDHILNGYKYSIKEVYRHGWFNSEENGLVINNTIYVLSGSRMIELTNDHCHLLFNIAAGDWAIQAARELSAFQKPAEVKTPRIVGFARHSDPN